MPDDPVRSFGTTRWTLVWRAADEDAAGARPALTELIRRYRQPLYLVARREGLSAEDAEDATQDFLQLLLSGHLLAAADPARGRFRSYLRTAWRRFLIDRYRRRSAAIRGGGQPVVSLDDRPAGGKPSNSWRSEALWQHFASHDDPPDRLFDRGWARSVLEAAEQRWLESYDAAGRRPLAEALLPRLTQPLTADENESIAEALGMNPGAVKVAAHRGRQRFGGIVRDVVAETVEDPDEVDVELQVLLQVLREGR